MKEVIKDYVVFTRFKKEIASYRKIIQEYNFQNKKKENSICVLPGAGPGSLGDEAMLRGMKDYFDKMGCNIYPIGFYEDQYWPFLNERIGLLPNSVDEWRVFLPKLLQFDKLYITGADMMDAGYGIKVVERRLILAYFASELGMDVCIMGFSFSDMAPKVLPKLYSILGKNVKFCLRDPISFERFNQVIKKQSQLVADIAFMMPVRKDSYKNPQVFDWCKKQQEMGKEILGVNICAHSISEDRKSITPENIESFIGIYEQAIGQFLNENENVSIVFIPHDIRGLFSDLNLALILNARLVSAFGVERFKVLEFECGADEIKALVAEVSYVFSGRMHLAIASIGVSTPVACVTYQGKFEGLYEFVGLNKVLLIQKMQFNIDSLYYVFNDLKENRKAYKDILLASYNKIQSYSRLNL